MSVNVDPFIDSRVKNPHTLSSQKVIRMVAAVISTGTVMLEEKVKYSRLIHTLKAYLCAYEGLVQILISIRYAAMTYVEIIL